MSPKRTVEIIWTSEDIVDWSKGHRGADGCLYRPDLGPGVANIEDLEDGSTIFNFTCPCGCCAVTFVGIEREK